MPPKVFVLRCGQTLFREEVLLPPLLLIIIAPHLRQPPPPPCLPLSSLVLVGCWINFLLTLAPLFWPSPHLLHSSTPHTSLDAHSKPIPFFALLRSQLLLLVLWEGWYQIKCTC
jgi:hypothetical protein